MGFERWSGADIIADLDDVLLPGTALLGGKYSIRSFLCSGGFGNTYIAIDACGREVVVKESFVPDFNRRQQTQVLCRSDGQRQNHARVVRSLLDEGAALNRLSHPNIVRAHDTFQENGTAYLVLDRIPGQDLQQIVEDAPQRLTPEGIVQLARQLVSALVQVHDKGLLHCDIAPDNICVTPDGVPVLIDFGSARACLRGVSQPYDGFTMVKDGFSPPELYTRNAALGPQADIYALGATLYLAIRGQVPAEAQARRNARIDGLPDPLPALAGTDPRYPAGFLASIDRALSVRAAARYASARDWRAVLGGVPGGGKPVVLLRTAGAAGPVVPTRPQRSNAGPSRPVCTPAS
ncbi:serine/threonine-protein kinase [Tabrizicola aquatica]|uniref:serine/threonine-protein kinase n=1 Tax=Tabrizicola aquatica TaxID=909926 RepID=UPI000CD07A16|nr:serine/threonine-protein kinase [Tabrizicola aquatica]